MANPSPASVNAATAPKAGATTAAPTTSTTTTVAPQDAPKAEAEDKDEAEHYRVLKAFTIDDGQTLMPGEKFAPGEVENWPARRTKQLVDQKFLRPIK